MCISVNTAVVNVRGGKLDSLLSIGLQLYIMSLLTQLVDYTISIYPARALRARAVTGRRCPHSGRGGDFLSRQPVFLRKQL